MIFCCTFLSACAQVLFKIGGQRLPNHLGLDLIPAVLLNLPLMGGLSLYGIFTVVMILALRKGELSLLYPIISLTYVWVTGISVWFLNEQMNAPKLIGLVLIISGVVVLGFRRSSKALSPEPLP